MRLVMAATSETAAFEQGIRPLMEIVLPDKRAAIIGFRAHPPASGPYRRTGPEIHRGSIDGRGTGRVLRFRPRE